MFEYIDYEHKDGTIERLNKLQAVQAEMQEFLEDLAEQKAVNELRKKPLKIEWYPRIYNKLESVLLKLERPMTNNNALKVISADKLYECYDMYCDLCCWIESIVGISYYKSKPEFCSFCGITTTAFANYVTDGDPHQREAVDDIDTRIANSIQMASENSEIKSTSAEFRLTAKNGMGHKIQTTTAHEPVAVIPITKNSFKKVDEYLSYVAVMPEPKQIGSGRK